MHGVAQRATGGTPLVLNAEVLHGEDLIPVVRQPPTKEVHSSCAGDGNADCGNIRHDGMALHPHRSQERYDQQMLPALPVHAVGSVDGDNIPHVGMTLQPPRSQERYRLQVLLAPAAHIDGNVVGDHSRHDGMASKPAL